MTERIIGSVDTKPDIVASMPLFCRMVGTKLKIASSTMLKAAKPQKKSTVSLVKTLPSVGLLPSSTASAGAAEAGSLTMTIISAVKTTTTAA